jgi:hypothetical protein
MTAIQTHGSPLHDDALPFDWRPAIERLRQDAATARAQGRANPLAEIEAECWLDLIEAEITAHGRLDQSRPEVAYTLHQLRNWRLELRHILDQLAAADGPAMGTSAKRQSARPGLLTAEIALPRS